MDHQAHGGGSTARRAGGSGGGGSGRGRGGSTGGGWGGPRPRGGDRPRNSYGPADSGRGVATYAPPKSSPNGAAHASSSERGRGVRGRRAGLTPMSVNLSEVKVVHFIRHGEAGHNLAAALHGKQAYRSWEFLDAKLTEKGREQARQARASLKAHMRPQVVLASPLTRAIETADEAFKPATDEEKGSMPRFEVMEELRERIGVNPCDKRRSLSVISSEFPHFSFASVAEEEDTLWRSDSREPYEDLHQRARTVLQMLRSRQENYIAVVSHSAFLTALFAVLASEEGLRNTSSPPDRIAAAKPGTPSATKKGKGKVHFANGEVKSVVLLPPPN